MILEKIQQTIAGSLLLLIFLFLSPDTSRAEDAAGPLYQGNRYPLMFMVMTPVPKSPVLPEGRFLVRLRTDYTSVHIDRQSDRFELLTDMELGVVTPEAEMKIGDHLSLGVSVPLISYSGGFLDGILADYHKLGNFPDYGRSLRPENEFACVVKKDGRTWFEPEQHGLHVGDTRLDLTYAFPGTAAFRAALMASLKLPTGDENKGFGSGKTDAGIFLITRFTHEKIALYLHPGVIFPEDPETKGADITYRTMATLFAGLEYIKSPAWSFMAQVNTFTSPLEDTGIDTLDNPSVELALGFTRRWGRNTKASFSFCEDLSGPAPDFTVHAGVETGFDL
jgi:hypothetical protein